MTQTDMGAYDAPSRSELQAAGLDPEAIGGLRRP